YSFLLAVSGVAYLCWYKVVHHYLKKEYKRIIIPIIAGAFFTYLAIEAQSHLGLMMLVSIAVFIFSEWLFQFFKTRSLKDRVVMQLTSVVSLFLLTWAGITIYEYVFSASLVVLHYDFINFGHFSNSAYEMIGFFDFPILGVGMTLYILSIIVSYKKDMVHRFLAITSLFFLFSFIFVIDNNASARYLVIAIMLIIPSVGTALYDMLQGVVIKKNRYKLLFVFISFILLLVPLSIPKVSQQHVLSKAPSDHVKFYYDVAYDYIKKNRQSDDVIFGMPFRSYYWGPDKESNILRIRREYSEAYKDADQMAALMYKHKKGWIVWPNGYYNIDSDVVQYIVENATAHHGIEDDLKKAGFRVFYFDFTKREVPEDIAYLLMKKYGELAEGALVRDEDSRILLYTNNELHWIRSASIFSKCGYKRKNVIDSTSEELLDELNSIVLGDSIESEKQCGVLQEGDLVRGVEDRRLYLFQNSELRWITSTLVIEECNLDRFSVVDVLQNNIRQLPKGKSINKGEDCTLN
ncbi:MAG: hypothetical protein KKG04_01645, partial [Candidatus Thermoplasmatota archaeon]|nr:hypothetical protein [Candidatus Thermoplasmatota archaeon]